MGESHIRGFVRTNALPKVSCCLLQDVETELFDWHVLVIYQLDGTPEMNAPGMFVEQGAFRFNVADPPPVVE